MTLGTTILDEEKYEIGKHGFPINVAPKIGNGATLRVWNKYVPCTITRVSPTETLLWMREDDVELDMPNGFDGFKTLKEANETQNWKITPNANNPEHKVYRTKRGWYCRAGEVTLGYRRYFFNYESQFRG